MKGARGSEKRPGEIRHSQTWIGGSRPGNARFVPPPPDVVPEALSALEKWIHSDDSLPPLVRIGLAHVQFETIHPFLDGNGRIGRLLIALLVEHWGLLRTPLLYLSVAFKRHRRAYYDRLNSVRVDGDWEGWIRFFLDCVTEAADDAVASAQKLHAVTAADRAKVTTHAKTTVPSIRLFELLPSHPMVTLPLSIKLLRVSKPTAVKALDALQAAGVLHEITGKRRDRVYAYQAYLKVLATDTD
jgi:Fic family protein